jgi:hypothetical protein
MKMTLPSMATQAGAVVVVEAAVAELAVGPGAGAEDPPVRAHRHDVLAAERHRAHRHLATGSTVILLCR